MKKMFYIAAAAVVAMTGCTQVEPTAIQEEISFNALSITGKDHTKALVNPLGTDTEDPFDQTDGFGVYAYEEGSYSAAKAFMSNVQIMKQESGDWKGYKAVSNEPYLWPANNLDFFAYYPYDATDSFVDIDFSQAMPAVKFNNVDLGTTIGTQTDYLVSAAALGKNQQNAKTGVDIVFKHTTSMIVFKVLDNTNTGSLKGKISVQEITLMNANHKGSYTDKAGAPAQGSWTLTTDKADFTPFTNATGVVVPSYDNTLPANGAKFVGFNALYDEMQANNAFIVMPQTIAAGEQQIKVKYHIAEFEANGNVYPAKDVESIVNVYDTVAPYNWQNGFRYIYTLAFTLDGVNNEITFNPVVTGWTDVEKGIEINAAEAYNK